MPTKIINTYYASGYSVAANTNLYITAKGSVGPDGIYAEFNSAIINDGKVNGGAKAGGILFQDGGSLTNGSATYTGALIEGLYGVTVGGAAGSVTNLGTIKAISSIYGQDDGVALFEGGSLTNGTTVDRSALVEGFQGVYIRNLPGTVANYGTILGQGSGAYDAVQLVQGGALTNGSVGDTSARIQAGVGVNFGGAGSVANFGAIIASFRQGVVLYGGGNVTNGAVTDTGAAITGVQQGVGLVLAGTVSNLGAISGTGAASGDTGVMLNNGGLLTNGANSDQIATIDGYSGVVMNGAGEVINYGAIRGSGALNSQHGIYLTSGGTVYNGLGTDRTALIQGAGGVAILGGLGTIRNSGAILATADAFGAALYAGGLVTNGSVNNPSALIQGYAGLFLYGGVGENFGTISGVGDRGLGIRLGNGAAIINGSAGHTSALIEGYDGVYVTSGESATVTNFGTIEGVGAAAVEFNSASDVLSVEAGSTFIGSVYGAGGTLNLASGTGTIANLGATALTVTGSMAATTFQNFNTVEVGAGATFTDAAAVTLTTAQTVIAAGTLTLGAAGKAVTSAGLIETSGGILTIAGALKNTGTLTADGGTLTVKGAVTGTGGLARIDGGTLDLASTFTQNVTFTGTTGVLELAQSQTYTGTITSFSKTGKTSLDLLDITFGKSTTATFSGTTTGGILTVTDGTHTAKINLKGNYTTSTFITSSDGHDGTTVVDPKAKPSVLAPAHQFIAAAAGLGGLTGDAVHTGEARGTQSPLLARPGAAAA